MITSKACRYGDFVLRGLVVALFTLAGSMKLTGHPFELRSFAHFGYETWFMHTIGMIEFVGAFAVLNARLILPATALLAAVLIGAIASHLRVADPLAAAAPAMIALVVLAGLAALHWPARTKASFD